MNKTAWATMVAATLTAALPASAADDVQVRLNENYSGIYFGDDPDKPDISIFVAPHNLNGMLAVCGLVIVETTNGTIRRAEKAMTRQSRLTLAGQKLRVRTAKFTRYDSMDAARAGDAGCSVTTLPWQPAYATAEIEFGKGRVMYTDQ